MSTGDPILDNPTTRNIMEYGYKNAPLDAGGYRVERGGGCYKDGTCVLGNHATATREHIDIVMDGKRPIAFDWHTHGNVGRPRQSGIPGDMYTHGISGPDRQDAEMVYQHPILKLLQNNTYPSYVVDDIHIYRITPDANGKAVVTTFNRWKE